MYYATQSPRGFANEIEVHGFTSKSKRDDWVTLHKHDGGMNSAACGAEAITAKPAHAILRRKSTGITEQFNQFIDHR